MIVNGEFWAEQQVMPVLVVDDEAHALPLARALAAGGLKRIEITLRTKAALGAINKIRSEAPEVFVGAGTVLNSANLSDAISAGAQFVVSPGSTSSLRQDLRDCQVPTLPGAATVSEAMELMNMGFKVAKFFPASESGGIKMLKSIASVLQEISFCPTGGITSENFRDYLELSNVVCVGGSWVAPKNLISGEKWEEITQLANEASKREGK